MTTSELITIEQRDVFDRHGVLIIPGFYDLRGQVTPVLQGIHDLIGLVIDKYELPISRSPFTPATFDAGFNELIAANRGYGAEIYDAVKQIPAFMRLLADARHEQLFSELRRDALPAIAANGYGIRIDNPFEDTFRANWHQEYPAQLRSLDGLVFWSPLLPITSELGPVEFCLGSHMEGVVPVYTRDPRNPEKSGAYSLTLKDEAELVAKYEHAAPHTNPGDLVIIDFMVLHASGRNVSDRSRWSMQFRYFNFREPTGIRIGWRGSHGAGIDFRSIHPELCADAS